MSETIVSAPDTASEAPAAPEATTQAPEAQGDHGQVQTPASPDTTTSPVDQAISTEPQAPGWTRQLRGDLQSDERLTGFKTPSELASAYLESVADADRTLRIPGEDATADEKREFLARLGRPDTPEGYELKRPDGYPEDVWNQIAHDMARSYHDLGLTKRQAQNLVQRHAEQAKAMMQAAQADRKRQIAANAQALKEKHGDDLNLKLELASRAFRQTGGENLQKTLAEAGLANHPAIVETFIRIGEALGDDVVLGADSGAGAPQEEDWYPNTTFD